MGLGRDRGRGGVGVWWGLGRGVVWWSVEVRK